ncbi:MAG TPA: hypothetical protein VFZ09_01225 [Archangium sp.]|uniref:hypothetical protein n=1 Tax=Archangium sp. TaxID=1872627 RepID=UPI002E30636F|nr:hypothetical protein [Archangium sp.]HEX5744830.1 hypothetical protein [Archangium sp.]
MDQVRSGSVITLAMSDSKGIEAGKFESVKGTAAGSLRIRGRARVKCETTAKPGGLSTAQQKLILDCLSVDLTLLKDGTEPLTPWQDVKFSKLNIAGKVMLEKAITGLGAATGLQAPLVVGTNFLTWDSYLPLSWVEFLNAWNKLGGMGDEQLRTVTITFKTGAEPLHGGDATVTLEEITLELYPDTQATPDGAQSWAPPIHYSTIVNSDDEEVATKDGLIFAVYAEDAALADTAFEKYRVTVGDRVRVDDPATPASFDAWFTKQPDTGEVESSITDTVTPFWRVQDMDINDIEPGVVKIKRIGGTNPFKLGYLYMGVPKTSQVNEAIKAFVQRLSPGREVHAVSRAYVHGIKVKDSLAPFMGFYVYDVNHPVAQTTPGRRCKYDGNVTTFLPKTMAYKAAQEYLVAKRLADTGQMQKIAWQLSEALPGAVISTKGFLGGISDPVRDVTEKLEKLSELLSRGGKAD